MKVSPSTLPVGVGVILSRGNHFCLSQRLDPNRAFLHFWQCPGGTKEPQEDALATAQRELAEEAGLHLPLHRFELLGEMPRLFDNGNPYVGITYHVQLTADEEVLYMEPHKSGPWTWVPFERLQDYKLIPGTYDYIKRLALKATCLV